MLEILKEEMMNFHAISKQVLETGQCVKVVSDVCHFEIPLNFKKCYLLN